MKSIVVTDIGKESVTDSAAFKHYRENAKYRDMEFTNHISVYKKVISEFYKKIGDALVESEGGVYIKGFGYFTVMMYPKKYIVRVPYNTDGFANFKTSNYLYVPTFFGQSGKNPLLNLWVMDRTFSRRAVKSRIHKALVAGKKYKTYVSTLLSLYSYKRKDK